MCSIFDGNGNGYAWVSHSIVLNTDSDKWTPCNSCNQNKHSFLLQYSCQSNSKTRHYVVGCDLYIQFDNGQCHKVEIRFESAFDLN